MGLGDWIGLQLSKLGITKLRYAKLLIFFHLAKPEDFSFGCSGCNKRQERFNRLGDLVQTRWLAFRRRLARLLASIKARVS